MEEPPKGYKNYKWLPSDFPDLDKLPRASKTRPSIWTVPAPKPKKIFSEFNDFFPAPSPSKPAIPPSKIYSVLPRDPYLPFRFRDVFLTDIPKFVVHELGSYEKLVVALRYRFSNWFAARWATNQIGYAAFTKFGALLGVYMLWNLWYQKIDNHYGEKHAYPKYTYFDAVILKFEEIQDSIEEHYSKLDAKPTVPAAGAEAKKH